MSDEARRPPSHIVPALLAVIAIASIITLVPADVQASHGGQSTLGCDDHTPLQIMEVNIDEAGEDALADDSFISDENAAFLHDGDQVEFQLVIENTLSPNNFPTGCGDDAAANEWTQDLEITIEYLPTDEDVRQDTFEVCDGSIPPGGDCTTRWFDLPDTSNNREIIVNEEDEQRVRFMISNDDPADLVGAERVLVVDHLPEVDLSPNDDGFWTSPEDEGDRYTRYGQTPDTEFNVTLTNNGDYENWNPNGGNGYVNRTSWWDFVEHETSEPTVSDAPDHPCQADYWGQGDSWGQDEAPLCSYRRGQILETPVSWQITPPDQPENVLQSGTSMTEMESPPFTEDTDDRDDAIGPLAEAEGETTFEFNAFHFQFLAGDYDMTIQLDQDPESAQETWIPNSDNEITETVEVLGVDLELTDIGLTIEGYDGLCTSLEGELCNPDDHIIQIDPNFANNGDDFDCQGTDACASYWNATVFLQVGDEEKKIVDDQDTNPLNERYDEVPEESESAQSIWGSTSLAQQDRGGSYLLMIALDHPDAYGEQDTGVQDFGRIAELVDETDCPEGYTDPGTWDGTATTDGTPAPSLDDASELYCIELFFEEPNAPTILNRTIVANGTAHDPFEDPPTVLEGENATFRTEVQAQAGIDRVNATFTYPEDEDGNQTVENVTMEPDEDREDLWVAEHSFEGQLGDYTYGVQAWDTLGQLSEPVEPAPFTVEELPKNISDAIGTDELNGETTVLGEDAPEFQGTADNLPDSADNWFNLTVNVTETGQDGEPGSVHFRVWDPDDEPRTPQIRMGTILVCWNLDQQQYVWGPLCNEDNSDSPFNGPLGDEKGAEWISWYADTTDDETWNHENLTLPWVGEFNVEIIAEDIFNRTNTYNWTAELRDRGDAELRNATIDPVELAPGDELSASGEAMDPLRVERVFLDVTKPSGETQQGNLSIQELRDAGTQNGTYGGTFLAGAEGDLFDQAGSYQVEMTVDDFGTNPNTTDLGTVTVDPGQAPVIESLFTDPGDEVEAGMNVTWTANIQAATAPQPPELTITRSDGTTETHTLTPDEDTGLWTLTLQPTPLEDEALWTYELEVRDWADQLDTATGEILILQNTAPHATNWQPDVPGDPLPWTNESPTFSVDLVDGNEVNDSSITLRLDGDTIWENETGDAEVQEIPQTCEGCYRITHTPSEAFEDGDTVTLEIKAKDHTEDGPLESEWQTRQFQVDATEPGASLDMAPMIQREAGAIIGATTTLEATVDDADSGPGDLFIQIESLAGTTAATRETRTVDDGELSFSLSDFEDAFRGHGEYRIEMAPHDAVGNGGDTIQEHLVYDEAPPQIAIEPQLDQPARFVAVNVTDLSEVQDATVRFTPDGEPEQSIELERQGGVWVGEIVNPETGDPYPEGTQIEYHIEARDTWENTGTTDTRAFEAGATPPSITITEPEDGTLLQGTVDIRWTATDEEVDPGALNISLWYSIDDGDPREIPAAGDLENTGEFQLDSTVLPNGDLELQAIAFDGATFGSDTVSVTVRNLDVFSSPELDGARDVDSRDVVSPGEETTFRVSIDENVRRAWANVTSQGEAVTSLDLEDEGGGVWSATFVAPEDEGDYAVDLTAMTPEGPISEENAYTFSVQGEEGKSFVPEWTILTILFAGSMALGAFGLARRWT